MITYREFRPTGFDRAGLGLDDRQDWLVAPVGTNRDADALTRSNWRVVLGDLESKDTGEDLEVHRFGHWGPGWFEIILVRPGSECAKCAEAWENALSDYPVACESDFSEEESEESLKVWKDCYSERERLEYIRENSNQFYFRNFRDMLRCVRGEVFLGVSSELLY